MPLIEPIIDDRSYQDILKEALARIPVHTPEWTNFNDSDPGITLVQLFSFMTENLLFRANLIPEKNRIKFLQLLGTEQKPAEPSMGMVTFANKGKVETIAPGVQLFGGPIPFLTHSGLDILPVESQVFFKAKLDISDAERERRRQEFLTFFADDATATQGDDIDFEFYETRPFPMHLPGAPAPGIDLTTDTVDGCLWVALLSPDGNVENTRKKISHKVLTLGLLPAGHDLRKTLKPLGNGDSPVDIPLVFERPHVISDQPAYAAMPSRAFGNPISEPAIVELSLPGEEDLATWTDLDPLEEGIDGMPPALEDNKVRDRLVTWIRIRVRRSAAHQREVPLRFVGSNAALVRQETQIIGEFIGDGTGEPDQSLTLSNTPVLLDSLVLAVGNERWKQIDDLSAAPAEAPPHGTLLDANYNKDASKVFTVERATGRILFGNGLRGMRPPFGIPVVASYATGGGIQGQVGVDTINQSPSLPANITVTNPVPTWGGINRESVEDAEKRAVKELQHKDRLVSSDDFVSLTLSTPGVDIGRVEVLSTHHPEFGRVAGVVTLMVIPQRDVFHPNTPHPDRFFLDSICRHLNPRRLVTTELHVRGPDYVPMYVSVGIDIQPGHNAGVVRKAVHDKLKKYLSPLEGGLEESGWPLSHTVERTELIAIINRVPGVFKVNNLLLGDGDVQAQERIPIANLDQPGVLGIAVQSGNPLPLDELAGTSRTALPDGSGLSGDGSSTGNSGDGDSEDGTGGEGTGGGGTGGDGGGSGEGTGGAADASTDGAGFGGKRSIPLPASSEDC